MKQAGGVVTITHALILILGLKQSYRGSPCACWWGWCILTSSLPRPKHCAQDAI